MGYTGDLKCNLKSVRMTDKVYNYVTQFDGEGFNQKFENMVLHFMEEEKQKKEEIEKLDKQIAQLREKAQRLNTKKTVIDHVMKSLQELQHEFGGEITT